METLVLTVLPPFYQPLQWYVEGFNVVHLKGTVLYPDRSLRNKEIPVVAVEVKCQYTDGFFKNHTTSSQNDAFCKFWWKCVLGYQKLYLSGRCKNQLHFIFTIAVKKGCGSYNLIYLHMKHKENHRISM